MTETPHELTILKDHPFSAADRMLVSHLREDWGESNTWILLAAALCNCSAREGHAYFDLAAPNVSGLRLPRHWPTLDQWADYLSKSQIARKAKSETRYPLVLAGESSLYLEKYYEFEQSLARHIRSRCVASAASPSDDAAARASVQSFFVITGGPGTGKTTLALRYLNELLDNWSGSRPARFAAIAPTGKAAARLAESIANGVARLDLAASRKSALIQIPCLTVHRLLGAMPHRSSFRRNAKRPIEFDALVVDESSMIDLPLMLRLFQALPERCQVLMLGDKDQLASVNVGSVLNDMLDAAENASSPLSGKVERLTKTYRFSEDSGIYQACQLARNGDHEAFLSFASSPAADFKWSKLSPDARRIPDSIVKLALAHHDTLVSCDSADEALAKLGDSILLMPTRQGAFGTVEINRLVSSRISAKLELDPLSPQALHASPLIVLENDYELELFNGDIGIAWLNPQSGIMEAHFPSLESQTRSFRLSELPRHELAFALTIHKSQGSEFESVHCVFGPDNERTLTRELLYTAFSRAKKSLTVTGNMDTLCSGIQRRAVRATRLTQLLSQ